MKTSCVLLASATLAFGGMQVVMADYLCKMVSGKCQFVNSPVCDGMYVRGLCRGVNARRCCIPINEDTCMAGQKILACKLLESPNIVARDWRETDIVNLGEDNTSPKHNLMAMCNGTRAQRSKSECYCVNKKWKLCSCPAPGGSICLNERMLTYLYALQYTGKVTILELAGGCHRCWTYHYAGMAVDLSGEDKRTAEYIDTCKVSGGKAYEEEGGDVHCQF